MLRDVTDGIQFAAAADTVASHFASDGLDGIAPVLQRDFMRELRAA